MKQMAQLAGVAPTNKTLLTVFRKFSGERFHCVARSPLLDSAVLTKSFLIDGEGIEIK